MTRVYLLDANGLCHWLYHSRMTDDSGREMTLLASKVMRWWDDFRARMRPTHFVACFDGARNWRCGVYAEYKSARRARPVDEEKVAALKKMPDIWASLGVHTLKFDEFEADDVIASLCARLYDEAELIVVSSDKDLMQLVEQFDDQPRQYDPRPNRLNECVFYDARAVDEKLGVPPHRVADLLAIMGDSSDSVPGIEGIGKVQAVNAIRQTKTADEIFSKAAKHRLDLITPKNQDKIASGREAFDLSMRLVSLSFDVPLNISLDDCAIKQQEAA